MTLGTRSWRARLIFTLIPILLAGCNPRTSDLEVIDYSPAAGETWPVSTPAEQGLDPDLVAQVYSDASEHPTIFGLLIIKNGYLVAEHYFNGKTATTKAPLASVTKSYVSSLTGIALEQGCLSSLDQRMMAFFPEYQDEIDDPRKDDITIRQLLQMRSGYPWEEFTPPYLSTLVSNNNWLPRLVEFPLTNDPGTAFGYSNLGAHIMGVIVARACETSLRGFGQENLFMPLDAQVGTWPYDADHYYFGSGDIAFNARDAAKFGSLYLNDGTFNGEQILPAQWVADSLRRYSEGIYNDQLGRYFRDLGYGYLWWSARVGDHHFNYAWGHGGNLIILLHDLDMVIVTTASNLPGVWGEEAWEKEGAIIDLVGKFIDSLPDEG